MQRINGFGAYDPMIRCTSVDTRLKKHFLTSIALGRQLPSGRQIALPSPSSRCGALSEVRRTCSGLVGIDFKFPQRVTVEGEGADGVAQNGRARAQRWEDYTQTALDPVDDCTIWYVGDYVKKGASSYSTKVGAFRLPGCSTRR